MEAGEVRARVGQALVEPREEPIGVDGAADRAPQPATVGPQKSKRIADADPRGHTKELGPRHGSGKPDVDWEVGAAVPHRPHPSSSDPRVEADLADDVRRELLLLE